MKYTSLFEKIGCLGQLITSSVIYPIFLSVLFVLMVVLFSKKIKRKKVVILILISYLFLFIIVIMNNYDALGKVFDSIATNLFTNIYFPSTYTYLFVLLVVDIITIFSFLDVKKEKIYKIVDGICFFIIQFIFALIMDTIAKDNVDIFSKKSLFTNSNLVVLLELSINIFILWLLSLFVIYVTNKIAERLLIKQTNKQLCNDPVTDLPNTLVIDDYQELEEDDKSIVVSDSYSNASAFDVSNTSIYDSVSLNELELEINDVNSYSDGDITDSVNNDDEVNSINNNFTNSDILFEQLLNNKLPLIYDEPDKQVVESLEVRDTYTLNDYRIFNKILKDIKETNNSNIINIDKELELKLTEKYTKEEYNLFKGMLKNYN